MVPTEELKDEIALLIDSLAEAATEERADDPLTS